MSSKSTSTSTSGQSNCETMLVKITTNDVPKLHCPICNKALVSLSGYMKHIKKHEPPGGFLCRYCEDQFCLEGELKRHCDENHTIIACRICKNVTFTNEIDYREHIRSIHNGIDREIFKCDRCGAEYKTIEPFRRHRDTQCGTVKPYKCDQCSMSFVTKYNLKQHKELHSGQRKFCCSYCGKNFLQKGRLVEHERSHTGEKPYKCDVCGKCFAHRESIVTHSSIHTGIRLVECKCCFSRFSCYSNLIKHRRTRPDTCGLPQYDPPKNRVRTHISRIPPTLNPTSEIKVNNVNKIIKPLELEQHKKTNKFGNRNEKIAKQNHKKNRRKKLGDEEEQYIFIDSNTDFKGECAENVSGLEPAAFNWCDSNKFAYFDPSNENEIEIEHRDLAPAQSEELSVKHENTGTNVDAKERVTELSQDGHSKDNSNIFNEKDEILDCLLNDGVQKVLSKCATVFKDIKDILDEPEMILMENEDVILQARDEEDILTVDNTNIALSYSKSEENINITVGINPQSKQKEIEGIKRPRKCKRIQEKSVGKLNNMPKMTQKELRAHLKMLKRDERSWQCPYCVKIYHMRKPFEKHLREDHERPEKEIRDMFKPELNAINDDNVYKCHICEKMYLVKKRLLAHMDLHGPNGDLIFKCPCYCNTYFATKDEATAHAQKEHRNLLYCNTCEKFMTGHDSLKNHMKTHHVSKGLRNQARNLVCDKCGKKFSGRTPLTDHVRSDCGRVPLYPCPICGKHLTTAGILKTHMMLHKDETPYQCDKCGKTFKVKAQYKMHIKTRHTDFKPFKCHLCPKEYPYRESLLTHMTVHTGIKRFLCNGCGKRFTCISNLQAHRKVQADTCGALPLNAKATQYMGVQKGNLLLGAKPEAGFDYQETNTIIAREVIPKAPVVQGLSLPLESTTPLVATTIANLF